MFFEKILIYKTFCNWLKYGANVHVSFRTFLVESSAKQTHTLFKVVMSPLIYTLKSGIQLHAEENRYILYMNDFHCASAQRIIQLLNRLVARSGFTFHILGVLMKLIFCVSKLYASIGNTDYELEQM